MKIAVLGLPVYPHLKELIVEQLSSLEHSIVVIEEVRTKGYKTGGLTGLHTSDNVRTVELVDLAHERLVQLIADEGIQQVVSFSDRAVVAAARLREQFGMGGNSVAIEERVVDKASTREWLCQGGLSKVGFKRATLDTLLEDASALNLPLIAKPVGLGASLCVELIRERSELQRYADRCRANVSFGNQRLVLEEYVAGPELSVEGMVIRGEVVFFGVTESHTSGEPYFVGTGHDFFAAHPKADEIYRYTAQVIARMGMNDCPFHIELKILDQGYEVIEVHTRYGGAMIMQLLEHATAIRPFSDYLRALAGGDVARPVPAAGVRSQLLLCASPGRLAKVGFDRDPSTDARVIECVVDHAPGDVIEDNVLPLQYVGHVTWVADSREDADRFRRELEERFVVEYAQGGP